MTLYIVSDEVLRREYKPVTALCLSGNAPMNTVFLYNITVLRNGNLSVYLSFLFEQSAQLEYVDCTEKQS